MKGSWTHPGQKILMKFYKRYMILKWMILSTNTLGKPRAV